MDSTCNRTRGFAPIGQEGFAVADRGILLGAHSNEFGTGAIKSCITLHYVFIRSIKRGHPLNPKRTTDAKRGQYLNKAILECPNFEASVLIC